MRSHKAKIGDIFEVKTPIGLAYVQYTHDHRTMGQLVRVLPGLHPRRPDVRQLAQAEEIYFVFYTLNHAIRDRQVEVVLNASIPAWARPFPIMRHAGAWDESGKTLNWLIGDGEKGVTLATIAEMLNVTALSLEQKKLSIAQLWPHSVMVKEVARGWTPERDEEFRLQDVAAAEAREKAKAGFPQEAKPQFLDHYLYFPQKSLAKQAGDRLQVKGWTVEVKRGADGENWLALAKQPAPIEENIAEVREELERLAEELHGEYDGWGAPV